MATLAHRSQPPSSLANPRQPSLTPVILCQPPSSLVNSCLPSQQSSTPVNLEESESTHFNLRQPRLTQDGILTRGHWLWPRGTFISLSLSVPVREGRRLDSAVGHPQVDVQVTGTHTKAGSNRANTFLTYSEHIVHIRRNKVQIGVPRFFFSSSFFGLRGQFPPSTQRFYNITQCSCSAPGSLWEMPDSNLRPLSQKSGALPKDSIN